ncbi:YkoP family protein [Salinithrix halophila]|uniref:YkoP-like domain-containing protein n=1 Tax=Salinithrix halophila TaxID=1485204 RepID=A0ABV8JCI8_9BACL
MTAGFLTAWRIWDRMYCLASRLQYVDRQQGNLFRIVVKRYRGKPVIIGDRIMLEPGDWYAKLHLHNLRIAQLLEKAVYDGVDGEVGMARLVLRETHKSLPALASYLNEHPHSAMIRVLMGTTLLHRGAERLGFVIKEIEDPRIRRFKFFYFRWIVRMCSPGRWRGSWKEKHFPAPKRVFLTRDQLEKLCNAGSSTWKKS